MKEPSISTLADDLCVAVRAELSFDVGLHACFNESLLKVSFLVNGTDVPQVRIEATGKDAWNLTVTRREVEEVVSKVTQAAVHPENLINGFCSTYYHATIRWSCGLRDGSENSGELALETREMDVEQVLSLELKESTLVQKLEKVIEEGWHCRTIAIYKIVRDFVEKVSAV